MSEKESFVFYRSFFEALQDLKDKEKVKVYDAICDLALNNNDTKLNGISKTVFTLIKPQILANTEKAKNGSKGGRPKKNEEIKTNGFQNKKPMVIPKNNLMSNVNVNVNDNVNVKENIKENAVGDSCVDGLHEYDSCVDGIQTIIDFYNNNIGLITPHGIEVLTDYSKEMSVDLIVMAMKKAVEANKRTLQYIKGILNNWSRKGIKTVLDAEQEDEQFRKQNTVIEKPKETKEERIARLKREWGVEDED